MISWLFVLCVCMTLLILNVQCTSRILSIMNIIYICFPADFLVWTLVSRYPPLISKITLILIFSKIIYIILQYVTQKKLHLNTKTKQWTQNCVKDLLYRKSSVHIHQLKQSLVICDCSSQRACLTWQTDGALPCHSWAPAHLKEATSVQSANALATFHYYLPVILSKLLGTSEILGSWSVWEYFLLPFGVC